MQFEARVALDGLGHAMLFQPLEITTRRVLVFDELFLCTLSDDF
jgi:hypothetical protein